MQIWHTRLEAGAEDGGTIHARDLAEELRRQDPESRDIDAIAGSQQNMIEGFGAAIEVEHNPAGNRARSLRPALHVTLVNRGFSHPAAPAFPQRRVNSSRSFAGSRRARPGISASQLSGNGPTADGAASASRSHHSAGFAALPSVRCASQ